MYIVEGPTVKADVKNDVATRFPLQVLTFELILQLTISINPLDNIILIRLIFTSCNWRIKTETQFILWYISTWVNHFNATSLDKSNLNNVFC